MTLTLWRGDELLGELRQRDRSVHERPSSHAKPPSLSAFLIPSRDAADLSGVWQIVWPPEVGIGVQQHAVEVDVVAERSQRAATRVSNPGPVALEPMSAEAVAGVPRAVQLTVRAVDGTVYLPQQLRLQEVRYEPALHDVALREAPREALVDGSVWCVFLHFASTAEAPAT
jgi:hypothetical protein